MAIVTGADVAAALGLPGTTPTLDAVALVANDLIAVYLAEDVDQVDPPTPVAEAGVVVAIDVLQNRTAAGGQSIGIDGSPGPYRMGPGLIARVSGLAGPWLHMGSEVG